MRIDGNSPARLYGYAANRSNDAGAAAFTPETAGETPGAAAAVPVAATAGIEALLALQAVDGPLLARRKALRRGRALLDTLDEIRTDMLTGRVSEGRLNQLMALIGQARERTLPGLDAALDEIELRARVELAKFGRIADV